MENRRILPALLSPLFKMLSWSEAIDTPMPIHASYLLIKVLVFIFKKLQVANEECG